MDGREIIGDGELYHSSEASYSSVCYVLLIEFYVLKVQRLKNKNKSYMCERVREYVLKYVFSCNDIS